MSELRTEQFKMHNSLGSTGLFAAAIINTGMRACTGESAHVACSKSYGEVTHCYVGWTELPETLQIHYVFDYELMSGHCTFGNILLLPKILGPPPLLSTICPQELWPRAQKNIRAEGGKI